MHIRTIEIKSISEWAIIGAISVREPIFNYKLEWQQNVSLIKLT